MSKSPIIAATVFAAALAPAFASATPAQAVKSAAHATVRGLEKAGDAVAHVAKAGVSGATYGVDKAGQAFTHLAKKAGLPTDSGSGSGPKDFSKTP